MVILEIPPIMLFFIFKRKLKKIILRIKKKLFNFIHCQGNAHYNHNTMVTFSQDKVTSIRFTLLPETTKRLNIEERWKEEIYKDYKTFVAQWICPQS